MSSTPKDQHHPPATDIAPRRHACFLVCVCLLTLVARSEGADIFFGQCDVVFEGNSTLQRFTGNITNVSLTVMCETNNAGEPVLNTRIEISPRQLTTHQAKRDEHMYTMFQSDRFPKLIVIVTNAPLFAARLSPANPPAGPGTLPVQMTFCGISKDVRAATMNPKPRADGWEFDILTELSLKDFNLKPPSMIFGAITVSDIVKVKAHVNLQKGAPTS